MSEKYETHVKSILAECPDADPDEIAAAFEKYEKEFLMEIETLSASEKERIINNSKIAKQIIAASLKAN